MKLDELQDLTVDEQKDELENLDRTQLERLREVEERQTALDNIERELNRRDTQSSEEDNDEGAGSTVEANPSSHAQASKSEVEGLDDTGGSEETDLEELEAKVDYLLEKSKVASVEGFKEWRGDNQ